MLRRLPSVGRCCAKPIEAIASQVRGFYGRPWVNGDAEAVVRELICECGDPACAASVLIQLGALSSGAVLAPGHR